MAMRDQMKALENELKNMSTQNVGLEKHMAMLRGKLSDAEAAAANLDQTRSQQAATILDLRKRLALEQTRNERMEFEMASMRQDLQKAMSDRGEIVGEKETLHGSIERLERQIAEMKTAHHEALRRFAERTMERIAFAEDLIAKTGCFSLAMLATGQEAIADAFAGRVEPADRFGIGQWGRWPSGQPYLQGAVTALDCEVIGAMETGTHVLFAGAIIEAETSTGASPLLWHRHGYQGLGGVD